MPKERNQFYKRLLSFRYLLVINVVIIVLLSLSLGREVVRNYEIQSEINSLEAQAEGLAAENIEISDLYTAIQTESYIEREARLKLGMKKPGESVVVVQDDHEGVLMEETTTQTLENSMQNLIKTVPKQELANTRKWWYYFFNKEQLNG